ncbi:hypothetical protein RB25_17875 [Herbaspirillum rubrisubalbicans]|uniref:LPP20 lipoprotein n=2 Tax=Herbaspirillum rubrisubalbicans TaxID=80842 RepID=A0ABX9C2I4_9BURK|nr:MULTISPECIES: hypothetical protein [Herbaspirillum]RAM64520.1 hypothetical protein RB24_11870 [Herbaspirillum rubrisubalbicans]RAN45631.1 hypothetical protein RB25_17875 [Herbaspirillum rubrisubalbicans]
MQVIRTLIALMLAMLLLPASAQIQQARGQYSINYKDALGVFDRKEAPAPIKQKARQEAALKAVESYYAEAGQSESANFDAIRAKILENQDRYILDTTVLSETDDPKELRYTVAVRVSLNVANLRNAVQASSAIGKAAQGEKSAMSFVFVSRQVDSAKSYDDRVYKRQDNSAQLVGSAVSKDSYKESTSEGESVRKSRVSTSGSATRETGQNVDVSVKTTVTSETGGSTTRKATETTWRVLPSANLNQVFVSKFSEAGYDVIEAAMVESAVFKIANIEADYKSGNDLQPQTLRAIAAGMKENQIPYIALGTLDVGLPDKDPQTGLMRVAVTVNAKVWDVTKPIPRTRLAVGPVAYAGVGPTEDEARGNALKAAASNAAQELSSRMTTMGLR